MPSLVKIKVVCTFLSTSNFLSLISILFISQQVEGRDLPVMDRNLQGEAFTDSYVEIWIGKNENHRTHTIRKTLNPVWDEEFRFEIVDDSLLQNTPVEFKVKIYSKNLFLVLHSIFL
jgi:Ca2+-dependent lipid-binding protein